MRSAQNPSPASPATSRPRLGGLPRMPAPRLMTASALHGLPVVDRAGQHLGWVEEVMLDIGRSRMAYAVVVAEASDRLLAVPWQALVLDSDRHCLVLDMARDRWREAPAFDRNHWPSQADEQWHREVHAFFRAPLYWD